MSYFQDFFCIMDPICLLVATTYLSLTTASTLALVSWWKNSKVTKSGQVTGVSGGCHIDQSERSPLAATHFDVPENRRRFRI